MNPYLSKISQLLVVSALKTLLILMVLSSGVVDSIESCSDSQLVKPAFFYNKCSGGFLGVRGKQIVANFEVRHSLYKITSANSHRFLFYDPEAKVFICLKHNKKRSSFRLVPKENPKNVSLCIFEEQISSVTSPYTTYVAQNYQDFVMSFKRKGIQRVIKRNNSLRIEKKRKSSCQEEAFLSSQSESNCSHVRNKFCDSLSKLRHHNRIIHKEIKHVCEIKDSSYYHRRNLM